MTSKKTPAPGTIRRALERAKLTGSRMETVAPWEAT
jgi:hypothetical protein